MEGWEEIDSRPIRCWIHPKLKEELSQWRSKINALAIKKTSYPVQYLEHLPLSSEICSMILKKVRLTLKSKDWKIVDGEKDSLKIEVLLNNKIGDNNNLNLEILKIKGIKKNEINFW